MAFYPVKRDGLTRVQDEFHAPGANDYGLMWTNSGKVVAHVKGEVAR